MYPPNAKISGSSKVVPYVFVGDDAFGLKRHMMKPYPFSHLCESKLVFNYRLSRARRVIENTFGICASRYSAFRLYFPFTIYTNESRTLQASTSTCDSIYTEREYKG